jgi:Phosphodiester glycosidase
LPQDFPDLKFDERAEIPLAIERLVMTTLVRRFKTRWHIIGLVLLLAVVLPESTAWGQQRPPDGFSPLIARAGVELYSDGPAENPRSRFVQVVSLSQGASVKLLHGRIDPEHQGIEMGPYRGDDPSFWRQPLQTFWDNFLASDSKAFCITNGQFFADKHSDRTPINPTTLAFSLKADGVYVSDGYAVAGPKEEFPHQKLMLEIWKDRADITELTRDNLYNSNAPNIIAGLTEDADRGPSTATGRTFIGVQDANGDDQFETILIFNSGSSTQLEAAGTLRSFGRSFGADEVKVMMLDGGGSTQLICEGQPYTSGDSRTLPQTLAVSAVGAAGPTKVTSLQVEVGIYDVTDKYPWPLVSSRFDPQHPQRELEVQILKKCSNNVLVPVYSNLHTVCYVSTKNAFTGSVDLVYFRPGDYTVKLKLSNTFRKQVSGMVTIGQRATTLPTKVVLQPGDINGDDTLNILDYNLLISCYGDLLPVGLDCPAATMPLTDLTDDGKVNQFDYNIIRRAFDNRAGK